MLRILTGPTAIGKSKIAVQIARQVGTEIISADSMQIYRGMDIGTAKAPLEVRSEIRHHLIDILYPWETYSVGHFVEGAIKIIKEAESNSRTTDARKGKEPLVVGGTALYIKALTEGLFNGPEADWKIRQELETVAAKKGTYYLHSVLEGVDPVSAQRIQKGDLRRVVRALEVYQKTGHPISFWQQEWSKGAPQQSTTSQKPPRARMVILYMNREELYHRIEERVERMFQEGLVEEVRQLIAHPMGIGRQAREALGYAEVIEYLEGKTTLSEVKELIKRNTRRFAKRQMTWFRGFVASTSDGQSTEAQWLEIKGDELGGVTKRVMEILYP